MRVRCHFLFWVFALSELLAGMSQEAYVWQRQWTPRLEAAVSEAPELVDGLTVLYGEFSPDSAERAFPAYVNFESLKQTGLPITLALRLNWSARLGVERSFAGEFSAWVLKAVQDAQQSGIILRGIEIDFDCPTSKLEAYATSLHTLRGRLNGLPLSITTLPTWMTRSEAFGELVAVTDHFVLQVHSIKRPNSFADDVSLSDPEDALRWTEEAARYGKPYHVALPTYAYRLAYDTGDKLVEVAGEDASLIQNPDWRYRVVWADPVAMQALVAELKAGRPDVCHGIIWYRLPIGNERHNWDSLTWSAVMSGHSGAEEWRLEARPQANGLFEIVLIQQNPIGRKPPKQVRLAWDSNLALAWDGQRQYSVRASADHALVWEWSAEMQAPLLSQGTRWTIGWVRFDQIPKLTLSYTQE